MSKKGDIYLKVVGAARVGDKNEAEPMSGKMVVKVQTVQGEDLIGFSFDSLGMVDACMNALHAIRNDMTRAEAVHPKLKGPTDGQTH